MSKTRLFSLIMVVLGLASLTSFLFTQQTYANDGIAQYTLEFIPTQNAASTTQSGVMRIRVNGNTKETVVHFSLRGGYPNTVYTIWTVFNILRLDLVNPSKATVPSDPATGRQGFPKEGNGVSPLARIGSRFSDGMGLDPGAVFITDNKGDGEVQVKLDYDLIWEAPVGNDDIIEQCAPSINNDTGKCDGELSPGFRRKSVRVTTTWLRKYVGQFHWSQRASMCANYDPRFDPETGGVSPIGGIDARYWQCVDPATVKDPNDPHTGLPRVHTFAFDHFRLAPHPDDLTHGFIGGSTVDHFIDMVGRRCDVAPSVCP